MKIVDAKTFVVGNPEPGFGGRYFVFVKLTTDGGVEGIGEAYGVPFHPHVAASMIEDVCARRVIDHDPFKIELLWRRVYSDGYSQHPDLATMGVLSGVEMACWDIIGKELDRPVYEVVSQFDSCVFGPGFFGFGAAASTSPTIHFASRSVLLTPASIAGLTRSVLWMRQKL